MGGARGSVGAVLTRCMAGPFSPAVSAVFPLDAPAPAPYIARTVAE